ncbi:hypothetical protein CIB48_g8252 [Xylaria polymorpha]|nr:hypothetical protein CIB48_g8252 [Xylaria polymorpha]
MLGDSGCPPNRQLEEAASPRFHPPLGYLASQPKNRHTLLIELHHSTRLAPNCYTAVFPLEKEIEETPSRIVPDSLIETVPVANTRPSFYQLVAPGSFRQVVSSRPSLDDANIWSGIVQPWRFVKRGQDLANAEH